MNDRVTLTLTAAPVIRNGIPAAKGRPRASARIGADGEPFVTMHTPTETRDAERAIRAAFKRKYPRHVPWSGPIMLNFTAVFAIPQAFNGKLRALARAGELYVTKKPDKDNIEKLIVDALNLVAFHDDAQIIGGGVKLYGERPRIEFSLRRLAQAATPAEKKAERARQAQLPLSRSAAPKSPPHNAGIPAPAAGERFNPYGGKPQPDLSAHTPRARALIEAALEKERRGRG